MCLRLWIRLGFKSPFKNINCRNGRGLAIIICGCGNSWQQLSLMWCTRFPSAGYIVSLQFHSVEYLDKCGLHAEITWYYIIIVVVEENGLLKCIWPQWRCPSGHRSHYGTDHRCHTSLWVACTFTHGDGGFNVLIRLCWAAGHRAYVHLVIRRKRGTVLGHLVKKAAWRIIQKQTTYSFPFNTF